MGHWTERLHKRPRDRRYVQQVHIRLVLIPPISITLSIYYLKSTTSSRVNDRKEDREKRRKESEVGVESPKKPKSDKPRSGQRREDTYITLRDGTRKRVEKKETEARTPSHGKNYDLSLTFLF